MPKRASKPAKPVKKAAAKPSARAKAPVRRKAKAASTKSKKAPEKATVEASSQETLLLVEPAKPEPATAGPAQSPPAPSESLLPPSMEESKPEMPVAPEAPQVKADSSVTETAPLLPPPETAEALPAAPSPASLPLPAEDHFEEEMPEEEGAPEEPLPPKREVPPNHIFIGKKPIMGYALSGVMQLTQYPEVVLRARGKAISRAVDVAEVILKRLGNGQFVTRSIEIDTDVVGEGSDRRNVSTIRISVGKAS